MRPFVCTDTDRYANADPRTDTNGYAIRILAEGDSWFSMGKLAAATACLWPVRGCTGGWWNWARRRRYGQRWRGT